MADTDATTNITIIQNDECIICESLVRVESRCNTCTTLVCLCCCINELRGLCPICEREELNQLHYCQYCHKAVRVGQYMDGYQCDVCGNDDYSCLECLENWRACCNGGYFSDSDSGSDSDSDSLTAQTQIS
jgi:hypothetical protein